MQICKTLTQLKDTISSIKSERKIIGFVPTMGALHEGHLSLYRRCKSECDVVVASIFVNPIQFTNAIDLEKYPRTEAQDLAMLESVGCDVVFMPSVEEMYAEKPTLTISFGEIEQVLEGKSRPGHFSGVGVVVAKLFHLVQPDRAYFGQKDLQQFLIIQRMVSQLSFPITLICCEILRDEDGLALSSRNARIPAPLRTQAAYIYKSLQLAAQYIKLNKLSEIKQDILQFYAPNTDLKLEYFEIVDANTLQVVSAALPSSNLAICVAAYLGDIRLIDNFLIATN